MTTKSNRVVVVHSGGLDSTVLLYKLFAQVGEDTDRILSFGVNYGQRHGKELLRANRICEALGIRRVYASLPNLGNLLHGNALTDESIEVPEGHYEEESMKQTVVPNRNMILLSLAIGVAVAEDFNVVAYGAHAGDHAIYSDCRPVFAKAMAVAAELCHDTPIDLITPFATYRKENIVRCGDSFDVPFMETWSCYKGGKMHCGVCGTCVERKEAFCLAGVDDPTEYNA